jgi:hypothetical protein
MRHRDADTARHACDTKPDVCRLAGRIAAAAVGESLTFVSELIPVWLCGLIPEGLRSADLELRTVSLLLERSLFF